MPIRIARWTLPLALAAWACLGAVPLVEDPPLIPVPKPGDIAGTITPPAKVASLEAVSRATLKTYKCESFDKQSGRFRFAGLPGDAEYDVRVNTADGGTVEGIDLSWIESRMLRLEAQRRKDLKLPEERKNQFGPDDAKAVLKWVEDWKDFMELKRVLYLRGDGTRAVLLVELMRTRDFYSAGGAFVWRMELWYMQNEFGGWDRLANSERVLHRKRITPDEWKKIDLQYYPELSVFISADGKSKPVHFTLPAKGDLSRGRLRNTEPTAKTEVHMFGVDTKGDAPTTAPAKAEE
jgi:hypothetical protein